MKYKITNSTLANKLNKTVGSIIKYSDLQKLWGEYTNDRISAYKNILLVEVKETKNTASNEEIKKDSKDKK